MMLITKLITASLKKSVFCKSGNAVQAFSAVFNYFLWWVLLTFIENSVQESMTIYLAQRGKCLEIFLIDDLWLDGLEVRPIWRTRLRHTHVVWWSLLRRSSNLHYLEIRCRYDSIDLTTLQSHHLTCDSNSWRRSLNLWLNNRLLHIRLSVRNRRLRFSRPLLGCFRWLGTYDTRDTHEDVVCKLTSVVNVTAAVVLIKKIADIEVAAAIICFQALGDRDSEMQSHVLGNITTITPVEDTIWYRAHFSDISSSLACAIK